MEWPEEILKELKLRDETEKTDSVYYKAFRQLSQLIEDSNIDANSVDLTAVLASPHPAKDDTKTLNKVEKENLVNQINSLQLHVETVEGKLSQSTKLNKSQEREITSLRNKIQNLSLEITEKNRAIETVNDELLSCNIQNNALNDRVLNLTQENENLVTRWMDRVRKDAEKINDANELIESLQKK